MTWKEPLRPIEGMRVEIASAVRGAPIEGVDGHLGNVYICFITGGERPAGFLTIGMDDLWVLGEGSGARHYQQVQEEAGLVFCSENKVISEKGFCESKMRT